VKTCAECDIEARWKIETRGRAESAEGVTEIALHIVFFCDQCLPPHHAQLIVDISPRRVFDLVEQRWLERAS